MKKFIIGLVIAVALGLLMGLAMTRMPEAKAVPAGLPAHIDNGKYEFVTGGHNHCFLLVGNTRTGELEKVYYKETGGKHWKLIKE